MNTVFNADIRRSNADTRGFGNEDIRVYLRAIREYPRLIGILGCAFLIFSILSLVPDSIYASAASDVKKGNLLYNNKKYDEAIKVYDNALDKKPGYSLLRFNKGDALYRKGTYNAAIESYNKALATGDVRVLPASDYNVGNSIYRIGTDQLKVDIKKTIESYESALEYYKRSIDLNPSDKDAKFNYEFVEQRLLALRERSEKEDKKKKEQEQNKDQKKEQDKQQQQNQQQNKQQQDKQDQQQQKQDQKQKDQQQQQQQKQGESQQDQQKDQQQNQQQKEEEQQQQKEQQQQNQEQKKEERGKEGQEQEKGEQEKEQQKPKSAAEEEKQKEQQKGEQEKEQQQPKEEPQQQGIQFYEQPEGGEQREMTEEEAKMLLEGYRGEEATGQSIRMRRKQVPLPEPDKDW